MAENKDIGQRIKEGFEAQNRPAPEGVWKDVADKGVISPVDTAMNAKLKEGFENLNQTAPQEVWTGVKRQVNIQQAWWGVRAMLKRRIALRKVRDVAAVLLLLLLLGWGGYSLMDNQQGEPVAQQDGIGLVNEDDKALQEKGDSKETELNEAGMVPTKKQETNDAGVTESVGISKTDGVSTANVVVAVSRESVTIAEATLTDLPDKESNVSETELKPMDFLSGMVVYEVEEPGIPVDYYNDIDLPEEPKEKRRRFDAGLFYCHNNTWLLNDETSNSFNQRSLISSDAAYASSYGLMGSWHFTGNDALAISVYLNSGVKQQYQIFSEGWYIGKDVKLDYGKVALLYQRDFWHGGLIRSATYNVKVGPYVGLLKKDEVVYTGVTASDDVGYSATDYGITVQAGQEIEQRRFVVGYGLNADKGLVNIFTGKGNVPADFDRTTTLSIGGYVNLRYKF